MGRRDAVQVTLELAAEWRRLGATVLFRPGWETRGNGTSANYEGGNVHHTGFGSSEANPNPGITTLEKGRPDLGPPLCNSAGPWCLPERPTIVIVAAHPANHAGASGGRSMGPMPVTSLFNPRSWGHEIDYGGNVAMSVGQYLAALIVTKGLANVLKRSTEYVRAHAETSVTGKWDPGYAPGKTIDMAAFRRDASAYTPQEDDLTPDEHNMLQQVYNGLYVGGASAPDGKSFAKFFEGVARRVERTEAQVTALTGAVAALAKDSSIDPDTIKQAMIEALQENVVKVDVAVNGSAQ